MGRYIDFDDVVARYPEIAKGKDATQVNTDYVTYAEAEVDARLSQKYTTPFSNNNLTVRDLSIDLTYLKMYQFKDQKKAKLIQTHIDKMIGELISGAASMVTTSGTIIGHDVAGTIYSTTMDYHPTFGMSDPIKLVVDSQHTTDEETARGIL